MLCLFFFFKQKTAYEMRISDWSSDVCSSDLDLGHRAFGGRRARAGVAGGHGDLRRRDARIRLDAQAADREHATERDQERDDTGDDRVVADKASHGRSVLLHRLAALPPLGRLVVRTRTLVVSGTGGGVRGD